MSALFSQLLVFSLIGSVLCQLCHDLDTNGCHLFISAQPNFCLTSPLANTTCPRSCGNCPLVCYHCPQTPVKDTQTCNTTQACVVGQMCMVNTLYSRDGHIEHLLSCIDKDTCNGFGFGFGFNSIIGKRHSSRDLRLRCCSTDLCNVPDVFTTTTMRHALTTTAVPLGFVSCHSDIVFVVDESSSVGYQNFQHVISFIKDLVTSLDIGTHGDQVSLLLYDNSPHLQWHLNDYTNKADLVNALSYVPYHNGTTAAHLALDFVRNDIFKYQNGDRQSAKNVVVVITDGRSNNHTATVTAAGNLRSDGVTIIALGVGNAQNMELLDMAGTYNHALKVIGGYDQLKGAESKVLQLIC